jgi:proteasome assembly chaperone (PAC2) family protein
MIVNRLKEIKAGEFTLFASLPDMGRVGGLVSSFLSQNLKMEQVAEMTSSDKPWVSYADGVVKNASDTYKISYDKRHKLMVFTGESQPQDPGELHRLCNMLLDYVQSVGKVKRLYGAGGYLREQVTGAPRACGVVNRPELKKVLSKAALISWATR